LLEKPISGNISGNQSEGSAVPKTQKTPLANYRSRMKRQGVVRVEIRVHKKDAELVRRIARALIDPEREAETRAHLRQRFGNPTPQGLKTLLAAAPLEGVDLERSRNIGRVVDL
jgi:hypothetical protein